MRYRFLRFPQGRSKAVTLSYDDGCPEDIRFSDTVTAHALKCTFNFNCDALRSVNLTQAQVEEHILSRGHEIAIHGAYHRAQGALRPIEGIHDVLMCRTELERRYGRIIRGMAYPDSGIRRFFNGADYDTVKRYLTDLDVVYARTTGEDNADFRLPTDWHAWAPTAHHANPHLFEWIDAFLAIDLSRPMSPAARYPRLFYLWGHSYEFERNHNWELLDTICERLGTHEDIWYATNMEIYEYVTAYRSLIYSADGRLVYNPTLHQIWFDQDSRLYHIDAGETLTVE
ncbi:MAG: polysaccharide deacetylase family protein [Clostridia bacterium]|nr:polysaccharide deacetylase family protein [Clostridia bacterium]